jgi:hypothetical protein
MFYAQYPTRPTPRPVAISPNKYASSSLCVCPFGSMVCLYNINERKKDEGLTQRRKSPFTQACWAYRWIVFLNLYR